MMRAASIAFGLLAAVSGLGFIAAFLGGYPGVIAHERLALIPLIAGLGAAVLEGWYRGSLSRRASLTSLGLLFFWVASLAILH